jgi:hypothetical protein
MCVCVCVMHKKEQYTLHNNNAYLLSQQFILLFANVIEIVVVDVDGIEHKRQRSE